MTTFLLTWDGSDAGFPPQDYAATVRATRKGKRAPGRWSMGRRGSGAAPGDRVFLLRQHSERGIVASGTLTSGDIYVAPHWADPQRTAKYADLVWDRVVPVKDRLSYEELVAVAQGHDWAHVLSSGTALPSPADLAVETRWRELLESLDGAPVVRKRPDWTWDETLLAYDVYLQEYANPRRNPSRRHEVVRDLSALLRSLHLHPTWARADPVFRNPDGVAFKIQNLMWHATGKQYGSANSSVTDERVVATMTDPQELHRIAAAIRAASHELPDAGLDPQEAEEPESVEGAVLEYRHKRRERDRKLVRKKKDALQKAGLPLTCEGCGIDMASTYDLKEGAVVECHHRLPLANGVRTTGLADLALVCPNCHRALHNGGRWASVEDLRRHLQQP